MSYFLVAVSTRQNLDLCMRHALAGFTNSISGLWTYLDILEGDYVSFLYGARAYNLYQVESKTAYKGAEALPPWPPLVLQPWGRLYHFPFRLHLSQVRSLEEPLVRAEFAYVAENLLLRGGYRKTHFQADQTTLQNVSEMGVPSSGSVESLDLPDAETFTPQIALAGQLSNPPYLFPQRELVIQATLRRFLSEPEKLDAFLEATGIAGLRASDLEVLGEKAFPEGHVDILIKEAAPKGLSRKVVVEVKLGAAASKDIQQLRMYMERLGEECAGGVLVARDFGKRVHQNAEDHGVTCLRYVLRHGGSESFPCDRLQAAFELHSATG